MPNTLVFNTLSIGSTGIAAAWLHIIYFLL